MPSVTRISSSAALDMVNAIVDKLDASSPTPGYVDIMDGAQPASVDTAITSQVLLGRLVLSDPAFGAAADQGTFARAVANSIGQDVSADAAGTATWFRAYDGGGTAVIDGNVGVTDEALILNNADIALNDTIDITTWNVELSEG